MIVPNVFIALAGLMGAAGVVLAAAGAHVASGVGLESASSMLLFHACATIGAALALRAEMLWRPLGLAAASGFVLGTVLFSGDLALRALTGNKLFPMAAPAGGMILIASWVLLSVAALVRRRNGYSP